jgi:hypothetical protein
VHAKFLKTRLYSGTRNFPSIEKVKKQFFRFFFT